MESTRRWRPASNGAARLRWFVWLEAAEGREIAYHENSVGRIVYFGSFEAAKARADKLNAIAQREIPGIAQTLDYGQSTFVQAARSAGFRRAVVYRIAGSKPAAWRIRVEKFPEHVNPGRHGWFGGRVLWGRDQAIRENAEAIALDWVATGTLPNSA